MLTLNNVLFNNLGAETLNRVHIIPDIQRFDLTSIRKGLLCVHAQWSGQSHMHGRQVLSVLDRHQLSDVEIHLVDIDQFPSRHQENLMGNLCHGYFESVWIEEFEIQYAYFDNSQGTELEGFLHFLWSKLHSR